MLYLLLLFHYDPIYVSAASLLENKFENRGLKQLLEKYCKVSHMRPIPRRH